MASVWIGTARGALGFRQLVAIKKPHPHLLEEPGFREELIAEARLASMIRHANVVDVRDVEEDGNSLSLVMDFIEGASLGDMLVAASKTPAGRIPPRVAVRIVRDACAGLHAAHELVDEKSRPVGLVHRDISPQNILVGEDGIARVTDFGVAKFAKKNMQSTSAGSLKGKLAYMAPEYLRSEPIDRRFDVFATGVVLWEALTGRRCFRGDSEADTFRRILETATPRVSTIDPALIALDDIVACSLEKSPAARFQNASAMGAALEHAATGAGLFASQSEVAASLKELLGPKIEERRAQVRAKLANEPTLQTLGAGGQPVMSPFAEPEAPKTEPAPTAGLPASITKSVPPATVTAPVAPPTVPERRVPDDIPPTLGSEPRVGANALAKTLGSEAGVPPTLGSEPRVGAGQTLGSGGVPLAFGSAPQLVARASPEAFTQQVTQSAYEVSELQPKKRNVLPFVIVGVAIAAVAVVGGIKLGRMSPGPAPSTATSVPSATTAVASAQAVTTTPAAETPAPNGSAPESVSAKLPGPRSPQHPTTTHAPPASTPVPTPKPTAPPSGPKRPPENPYE
jgi:serine/threonine-protein kinase